MVRRICQFKMERSARRKATEPRPELSLARLAVLCILLSTATECVGRNMILPGQTVPTHPGLPHTLKFNVKVNGTCGDGHPAAAKKLLVSLHPSSSEFNMLDVDSNGGLWKAEELRFLAIENAVNLTFASVVEDSSCCLVIGNVEVGLEDGYLKFVAAKKLWKRLLCLYGLLAISGALALLAVSVACVGGSVRGRT